MSIITCLQANPAAFALAMGVTGLVIGSFLNVVIHRLPKMMENDWRAQCAELMRQEPTHHQNPGPYNLAHPRSHCPHCGHPIGPFENIPIISYLLQGGRCRACNKAISVRYPIVELASGILAATVAWYYGFGTQALLAALLSWALISLSFIDLDTGYLPDSITVPGLWLGLASNFFGTFASLEASVLGAMGGYLTLWTVYHAFKLATGKEGMGYGDFKLLAMLGAWMGWQLLPVVIILSSIMGSLVGITVVLSRGKDRDTRIPFGPYLACAGWIALLWGRDISDLYLHSTGVG